MTSELVQLSLCKETDYEGLLANIALIKCLLECDDNGNVNVSGAVGDMLRALFGHSVKTGTWPWEFGPTGPAGLWYETLALPGSSGIVGVTGCFDHLFLHYFNKTCSTNSIEWNPTVEDCIAQALAIIKGADYQSNIVAGASGYISLGFTTPNPVDGNYAPYKSFHDLANLFAEGFQRVANGVAVGALPYNYALTVLSGFCELLKQRITLERKMRKCQLTISHCDFP